MFKDTNSHRLDSTQFMCVSGKFFGVNISTVKSKKNSKNWWHHPRSSSYRKNEEKIKLIKKT